MKQNGILKTEISF